MYKNSSQLSNHPTIVPFQLQLSKESNLPPGLLHTPGSNRRGGAGSGARSRSRGVSITEGSSGQRGHVKRALLDVLLLLGEVLPPALRHVKVVLDDLLGGEGKPLGGADIGKLGRLQDLEEDDVLGTSVLDVVAGRLRDVADAAGREVEGAGSLGCLEHSDAGGSLQEVVPLRGGRVPVDLAHGTRLHDYEGGGEVGRDGEGGWVEDLDGAAGGLVGLLLGPVVGVGAGGAVE